MKSWLIIRCIIAATVVTAIQGCGDETTQPQPHHEKTLEELIAGTPKPNQEAELAALWLSQELIAPDTLYDQMVQFLQLLRRDYREDVPCLDTVSFRHSWSHSTIGLYLDTAAESRFLNGEFHDADSMNALFHGTIWGSETDTSMPWFYVAYQFAGLLNLDSLASSYGKLPGVTYASASWIGRGDGSNLYPGRDPEGRLTFLLRQAWGDCPAGCIYSHFWYFKFDGESIELVGDYLADYVNEPPDWWDEGKVSYDRYRHRSTGARPRGSYGSTP